MTLTKADLAKKVADDCGFMKGEAQEIVDKLLDVIKSSLISGEDVMISGLVKWSVKEKRARRGRNPQTGKSLVLDERRVVTWKYSPVLKKARWSTGVLHVPYYKNGLDVGHYNWKILISLEIVTLALALPGWSTPVDGTRLLPGDRQIKRWGSSVLRFARESPETRSEQR
jgi:integration host factor subunit alpha